MDRVTKAQKAEYKKAFSQVDKNNTGCIPTGELGTVMRLLGLTPSEAELEAMIHEVDPNGNGIIHFNTFLMLVVRKMEVRITEEDIREAFRVFDINGNGYIHVAELRFALANCGETLTEEELDGIIQDIDINGDGRIYLQTFINIMMYRGIAD